MPNKLFPVDQPLLQWGEFTAEGFSETVSGVLFTAEDYPCCGLPLGGLGTGCLDIDARGVYGFCSIFNPVAQHRVYTAKRMPRKPPLIKPIIGLAVNDKTWVMTTPQMISGEEIDWCTEPELIAIQGEKVEQLKFSAFKLEGVETANRIHYWGHYPVVDMEFDTDAPVSIGLRAWSPFIPGDYAASNTPGAVFEVHLRNDTPQGLKGTIAINFPGPDYEEAKSIEFSRHYIRENFQGLLVKSPFMQYLLGVMGEKDARFGEGLGKTSTDWSNISVELPQPSFREINGKKLYQSASISTAVDFDLQPGQEKIIRFILVWYAPVWEGAKKGFEGDQLFVNGKLWMRWMGPDLSGNTNYYSQMYAARFRNAIEVARYLSANHEGLLRRIFNWQSVIYNEESLPIWLRDSLINNLALLAEDSHWAQARPPLGKWAFPGGLFGLNESPRGCPHMDCIPCDWYGNLPIVLFFPDLALSTLRAFKQYQLENGEIPFAIGTSFELPDFATPQYYQQVSLNGLCYIDLVDRLWQITGEDRILREFYPSMKKCNTFTMDLKKGPGGPISMPEIGGMEWFEVGEWVGMAAHMGGLRLAELRMMERMAQAVGDLPYADQCRAWFLDGSKAMEEILWTGRYYLNFYEIETGKKSDDVMAYQLDGHWVANFHGLPGIFRPERVRSVLETIKKCNIALTPDTGAANFARPDGSPLGIGSKVAEYGVYTIFTSELVVLALTYIYSGELEFGLELARKHWECIAIKDRRAWDLPNLVDGSTGKRFYGTDYYQDLMLWALPAAVMGENLRLLRKPGGFVDRILDAGIK